MTTPITVLAPTITTALASTRAAPNIVGPWQDISGHQGGVVAWKVENTGLAPALPGQFMIQGAQVGNEASATDIWGGSGNTTASGSTAASNKETGYIPVRPQINFVRMLGWANTGQHVTFSADFIPTV